MVKPEGVQLIAAHQQKIFKRTLLSVAVADEANIAKTVPKLTSKLQAHEMLYVVIKLEFQKSLLKHIVTMIVKQYTYTDINITINTYSNICS